jgi:hypothetical protein
MGLRKSKMWGKIKMVNTIKSVRSEEMGVEKSSRFLKYRDRQSKIELPSTKQV